MILYLSGDDLVLGRRRPYTQAKRLWLHFLPKVQPIYLTILDTVWTQLMS